jgi:hypothetical protein
LILVTGVVYASTFGEENPRPRLDAAIFALLNSIPAAEVDEDSQPSEPIKKTAQVIYSFSYDQRCPTNQNPCLGKWHSICSTSLDLAFDDDILVNVEDAWRVVMDYPVRGQEGDLDATSSFMVFEDREQIGATDEDDE